MPCRISTQLWVSDADVRAPSQTRLHRDVSVTICTRCVLVLSVLDGDPKNYMAYYSRATVFLAMGKSKSALPDLSKVIQLKPDFTSVRLSS